MYGHDVQSINELFIAERNTIIKCYKHSQKQLKCHLANDNAKCNVFYNRRCTDCSHNFTPLL